jgi:hypothetical protein
LRFFVIFAVGMNEVGKNVVAIAVEVKLRARDSGELA